MRKIAYVGALEMIGVITTEFGVIGNYQMIKKQYWRRVL